MFSSSNGSSSGNNSKNVILKVITFTDKVCVKIKIKDNLYTISQREKIADKLNFPLRKVMHFSEYLILCLLWINILSLINLKHKYLVSFIICVFYACTDEAHQLFVDGRAGRVFDVFIDTSGVFVGVLINKIKDKCLSK